MNESAEVLLKKARYELDEIAVKLGINTAGLAKTRIAESIVEARNKAAAKVTPKPKTETPKAATPKIKEAPKVEVNKQEIKISVGKNGVYAKCQAIDAQINENNEAVAVIGVGIDEINKGIKGLRSDMDKKSVKMHKDGASMLQQGIKELNKGVKEKLNGIDAQIKANKMAAANMEKGVKEIHLGIKEMQTSIDRKADEIQVGIKVMYSGVKVIQNGIQEMGNKFEDFRTETANYKHDFYYG